MRMMRALFKLAGHGKRNSLLIITLAHYFPIKININNYKSLYVNVLIIGKFTRVSSVSNSDSNEQ